MSSPRLVLLDEPLAGLNAAERAAMTTTILRARQELGIAFLIAERALPFAIGGSDRIIVLDGGRIRGEGRTGEVHPSAVSSADFRARSQIAAAAARTEPWLDRPGPGSWRVARINDS